MPMFVFKTKDLIWIGEGASEPEAKEALCQAIHREWSAAAGDDRQRDVRAVKGERVPSMVRLIRTFPLSDMGVY